ncbi:ADP-ribose pyrophosphatase YjhB, NUDIX family [Malonomonas rubra DSM 5091]|uniref:ADP-ribose pyrophosphatase YjhB, NUDIX family n=1 Tax=Malonomonas rubra DSM 5091 TaxID=1122189 RepID=A0A1M6G3P9_MALRU|nr:NUDIX hydrolase [Malonomonas rubra]SHJ04579.1 ADP-ribose pyrophosphatase YjhB, NUDIX family [Malonomonas rubra DSM 5091]
MEFNYCPCCGGRITHKEFDTLIRHYCEQCERIHYRNPIVGVAIIIMQAGKILLARRNNSYAGKWCIPCGYVEWDEDVRNAAIREFAEETGLEATIDRVFNVHSNFHDKGSQTVGIWFLGQMVGGEIKAGSDVDEVAWFDLDDPPEMAFPTDCLILNELKDSL